MTTYFECQDIQKVTTEKENYYGKFRAQKMASYSYRTATTTDPCYVPVLGDYVGAGRMRLAAANIEIHFTARNKKLSNY